MFITVGDAKLHVLRFGYGPRTLLAFGGWAGSWQLWAEPFFYLSPDYQAVAYDHRGSGATVAPLESITAENLVADVFAVMDTLSLGRCILAAESAGATIALLAALARPTRFEGLVLVDGLIHHPAPAEANSFIQALRADFEATVAAFAEQCAPGAKYDVIRRWGRQILNESGPAAAIRLIECLAGIDLRPRVKDVALPTVLIHGEADTVVPLAESQWLADQMPHAKLHTLPGAGHVPTMTHPGKVATIIQLAFPPFGQEYYSNPRGD